MLGYNMYLYCRNNPINWVDIDGEAEMDIFDSDTRDDLFPKTDGGAASHYKGISASSGSGLKDAFNAADHYNLNANTYKNHILDRHGPDSTKANKSHFDESFDILSGIDSTLKGDNSIVLPNTFGRAGYIFEQTFNFTIGRSSRGELLYTIKVVLDWLGNVITAFPK